MTEATQPSFAPMLLTDLFDTVGASKAWIDKVRIDHRGTPEVPYVTNKLRDNGIECLIPLGQRDARGEVMVPNPGGTITVPFIAPYAAFQAKPFYTGQNVHCLRAERLTEASAVVLIAALTSAMRCFDWSTKATARRLYRARLMVPVTKSGQADWYAMERLGQRALGASWSDAVAALAQFLPPAEPDGLPVLDFAPRLITEVFETVQSSRAAMDGIRVNRKGAPVFAYVTRTAGSNGIADVIPRQPIEPNPGNVITVGLDTQTAAYQPRPFYTGQNVHVLGSPHLDRDAAMVLVPLVRQQLAKFSWGGNGATLGRLRRTQMMVPITQDGSVDWNGLRLVGQYLLRQAALRAQEASRPVAPGSS